MVVKGRYAKYLNKQYLHQACFDKQKGVAAIWMGLSLIPIFGFAFWAVEGTRYVQESSRLKDATEAAVIAVTIADSQDNSNAMADGYINAYVRDIEASQFDIVRTHQERNDEKEIIESIAYSVNSTTTHDSWFASNFIPSFNETQNLVGKSTAKKYVNLLGENNVDIVFVSDFSGSMNDKIFADTKIDYLKSSITEISEMLLCSSVDNVDDDGMCSDDSKSLTNKLDNRVAFVPYNIRTREKKDGKTYVSTQLRYRQNFRPNVSSTDYESVYWDTWAKYSYQNIKKIANCPSSHNNFDCNNYDNDQISEVKRLLDVLQHDAPQNTGFYRRNYETYDYVDLPGSIEQMMVNKFQGADNRTAFGTDNNLLFLGWQSDNDDYGNEDDAFWNIELTNNLKSIDDVDKMKAGGHTAAFQGILRGVQLLAAGNPNSNDQEVQEQYNKKSKIMLILSDGMESPNNGVLKGLVSHGMCNTAREKIPGLYIGIIGIGFKANKQSGFQDCVLDTEEDIINVDNLDYLLEKIEELIAKGATANGVTKLY